jgi:hypothetical protein
MLQREETLDGAEQRMGHHFLKMDPQHVETPRINAGGYTIGVNMGMHYWIFAASSPLSSIMSLYSAHVPVAWLPTIPAPFLIDGVS